MSELLFCTAMRRLLASIVLGLLVSFVIGSFLSFFIFFTTQAVEGQSHDTAKASVFRVYVSVFLFAAFAIHLFGLQKFRNWRRKPPAEVTKPRPAFCAGLVALFFLLSLFPSTTEKTKDSFEFADNPVERESSYGWPAPFVTIQDFHGTKTTVWYRPFLLVNALILVLGMANILAFDGGSLSEEAIAQKKREDEASGDSEDSDDGDDEKKDGPDDPEDPPGPPPAEDAPDLRKSLTKESTTPRTLELD